MFGRTADPHTTNATEHTGDSARGPSLARGPAWIAGVLLAGFGLAMFFRSPGTPLSTAGFPDGSAVGDTFLGIETNAWTAWGTTAAGVLVLMGAAQHALAKLVSMIAGVALGLAAVLAIVDGDVLGLAAANTWTIVGWGAASAVLLATALLPRVTRHEDAMVAETPRERAIDRERGAAPAASAPAAAEPVEPVTAGGVRSEPLRRTYQEHEGPTEAEVQAAERARADERSRLS